MKKIFVFIISIALLFSCNNKVQEKKTCNVNGFITGFFVGKIILYRYIDNKLSPIDSTWVKKSMFKFNDLEISQPEVYYFVIGENQAVIECFLEPGDININADISRKNLLEITGSKSQYEYSSFLENNSIYENKQMQIYNQKEFSLQNGDTAMIAILDSSYNAVYEEQIQFIKKYVKANMDNVVALFVTARSLKDIISLNELKSILVNFDAKLKNSVYYAEIVEKINTEEHVALEEQAPDFSLPDIYGKLISLSSQQGKYVLLDFSASWHRPSRSRNAYLDEIYKRYKDEGFEIYTVSLESDKNQWFKVLKRDNIKWIQTSDLKGTNSDIVKLYGITKLPSTFLLDKKGNIIAKNLSRVELESELTKIFK